MMVGNDAPQFSQHQECQALTGLTREHLPRDHSLGRVRQYRQGTDIWRPDDHTDRIYFLERGQVAVLTRALQGHEIIMRVIEAGEPFGELCFCAAEQGVQHTTAHAVIDSAAVEITLGDFMSYLQQNREALTAFVFTFCVRLSDTERRAEMLAYRGAEERLGRLLLQLAATRGHPSTTDPGEVTLHVSHDELARMAAMSRSHVTVTMGKLRRRGLVRYARNHPLMVVVASLTASLMEAHTGDK